MSAISNSSISIIAQRAMSQAQGRASQSMERLSTGLKINHGADDPSGLITNDSFKTEQAGLLQGMENAQRAGNMIGTAESTLGDVSGMLVELRGLVNGAANSGSTTNDERDASQLQVDSIISQIQKVSGLTQFAGKKLLDGSLGYKTTGVVATSMTNLNVNSAKMAAGTTRTMNIAVQTAATRATSVYSGGTLAVGNNVTLELAGNAGTNQVSFGAGTTVAQMATTINAGTNDTGVQATVVGANLQIESADFGSGQNIAVRTISGTFAASLANATGTDAAVRVNGALAAAQGTNVTYRDAGTDFSFALTATSNVAAATTAFTVTGGGADFMLGSKVNETNHASIGIQSIAPTSLGNATVGFLSSLKSGEANSLSNTANLSAAQKIADASATQIGSLRGRLGAFQRYTVQSSVNVLQAEYEAVSSAQSSIANTDYASETANLVREQMMQQAAQATFSTATQSSQQVLSLLNNIR